MKIKWYGHSLFELTTKPKKQEKVRVVIDPYDKKIIETVRGVGYVIRIEEEN